MNVLHLATFDAHGGAGVAALRLVESLRRRGHNSRLLVRDKATQHQFVESFNEAQSRAATPLTDPAVTQLAWLFSRHGRPSGSKMAFSSDVPTYDLTTHPAVRAADLLHLHWVTGFLSAFAIRQLQDLGKPVVWTLHDQFPFTGGCHYAESCRGFRTTCARCPQLVRAAQPLANLTLAARRQFIDARRLLLAAPSNWIATTARQSALFKRARIEVVPYGVDVRARRAGTREGARADLQIPADALVVLAAGIDHRDPRKGYALLESALALLYSKLARRTPGLRERLFVLTAGQGTDADRIGGIRCRALGVLAADDPRLTMAFRAADIFALPSLEDNLPNTMLEAMAAGTPVVAYNVGGIPDLIRDGENGRLVRRGNIKALASALADLAADDGLRLRLGDAAALTARTRFDWSIQAEAYERLYAAELARRSRRSVQRPRVSVAFKKNPYADVPKIQTLLSNRPAGDLLTVLLRKNIDELGAVIAARGGEIMALRDEIARHSGVVGDAEVHIGKLAEEHRRQEAKLQDVIAARGGEIRDLRKALGEAQQAAARRKEVLSQLMRAERHGLQSRERLAVGIFGVGESGRRVLEASVLLDCNIVWLSDNNTDLHGQTDLGCAVIRPDAMSGRSFDAVIIASAHRDAIRQQLLRLGIEAGRIIAPDITRTDAELLEELRRLLEPRHHAASHSARSSTGRS